jgi:hypothetical protein
MLKGSAAGQAVKAASPKSRSRGPKAGNSKTKLEKD